MVKKAPRLELPPSGKRGRSQHLKGESPKPPKPRNPPQAHAQRDAGRLEAIRTSLAGMKQKLAVV